MADGGDKMSKNGGEHNFRPGHPSCLFTWRGAPVMQGATGAAAGALSAAHLQTLYRGAGSAPTAVPARATPAQQHQLGCQQYSSASLGVSTAAPA
ncbi:hypothetical protein B484DRAFT_407607 [Ochromonadaceae sp. CCMP2298]|nr:hypothetical protein B484DRAFT_407607 [Ochromonadaceae sp. CCMP2298]